MTISEDYRNLNRQLHADNKNFGTSGKKWAEAVKLIHERFKLDSILDYGCGKQTLSAALPNLNIIGYDPAIPELSAKPSAADLVVCGDVLEHIEPEYLDKVIDDLCQLSKKLLFVVLSTREAKKLLLDGRNAHLIVKPADWWINKFEGRFEIIFIFENQKTSELILLMSSKKPKLRIFLNTFGRVFGGRDLYSRMFLACSRGHMK